MASGKLPQGPPSTSWGHTAEAHFDKGAAINGIRWDAGPGTMEPADLEGGVRRYRGMQPLDSEQAAAQRRRRLWLAAAGIALLLVGIGIGAGIGFGVSSSDDGGSDPPPQEDNTQAGGGQLVAPTPAGQPTAPTPAGPPTVPTPAAATGSVREGGPCELDAECGAVNSTCIKLVANAAKKPPGICTSLAPDGAACETSGGCFSGDCDIGGSYTGSEQCLVTLGEPCSTGKQCADYSTSASGNKCVEGLCTEPPED